MIKNFVVVRNCGIKTGMGEFVPSVPILEQINNAAFHTKAYEWEHDGQKYTRLADGNATLNARPLPDGSGIVVPQNPDIYGPDNVAVLNPANEIRQRIPNPYKSSELFMAGDRRASTL